MQFPTPQKFWLRLVIQAPHDKSKLRFTTGCCREWSSMWRKHATRSMRICISIDYHIIKGNTLNQRVRALRCARTLKIRALRCAPGSKTVPGYHLQSLNLLKICLRGVPPTIQPSQLTQLTQPIGPGQLSKPSPASSASLARRLFCENAKWVEFRGQRSAKS